MYIWQHRISVILVCSLAFQHKELLKRFILSSAKCCMVLTPKLMSSLPVFFLFLISDNTLILLLKDSGMTFSKQTFVVLFMVEVN